MIFRSSLAMPFFLSLFLLQAPSNAGAFELKDQDLAPKFEKFQSACFELLDCKSGKAYRYNRKQCAKRLPPCSTFKIFNSLCGLESGVLKDENHLMKWDGEKRFIDSWNQDQTLQSAVTNSCVWYFQKVAQGVGAERMKKYLSSCHYGNEDISGGLTEFWLGNSLVISADEQVDFIKRLYFDELPFSKRSMKIVKQITEVKKTGLGELHGKTGSDYKNEKWILGWFVGYVLHKGQAYVFACNLEAEDGAKGAKAREICQSILQEAGLL